MFKSCNLASVGKCFGQDGDYMQPIAGFYKAHTVDQIVQYFMASKAHSGHLGWGKQHDWSIYRPSGGKSYKSAKSHKSAKSYKSAKSHKSHKSHEKLGKKSGEKSGEMSGAHSMAEFHKLYIRGCG